LSRPARRHIIDDLEGVEFAVLRQARANKLIAEAFRQWTGTSPRKRVM